MKNTQNPEVDRIDTLIITVGTRQVGWRCKDGIVRCLGTDGDRGYPPHINELYQELEVERKEHEPGKSNALWGVRDLGHRLYEHCTEWLGGDFSQVQLLIDDKIIAESAAKNLQQVILWAPDQPDTVPWNYRRADTIWLAKLMQGKIQSTWPEIKQVEVLHPVIDANDKKLIRQEIEGFILPLALEFVQTKPQDTLVLAIQNKGAVPKVAESLEICAAALVRQCQVINATPVEPDPPYLETDAGKLAQTSSEYDLVFVSESFWPLERLRVISAWERGDFQEAQVWLEAHKLEHQSLYQLAGGLAVCTNWQLKKFLSDCKNGWLKSKVVLKSAGEAQVEEWRSQLSDLQENSFLQTWESVFLIELLLTRGNYTSALMHFSQTIERLLYLQHQEKHTFNRTYEQLINDWLKAHPPKDYQRWFKFLHGVRQKRNDVVHHAEPVSLANLRSLWANNGFPVTISEDSAVIMQLMLQVFQEICRPAWDIPKVSFLRSLYDWGLQVLRADTPLN